MIKGKNLSGVVLLMTVLPSLATDIVDLCLVDSIYIGHEEGILGVELNTINDRTERPCILRIETCSSCQLSVEPHGDDFSFDSCSFGKDHSTVTCTPGCEYIYLFDAFYRNKTLKFYRSSQNNEWFHPFQTMSSGLFVGLCHKGSPLKFQLKYTTKDKWTTYESSSKELMHIGKISSPFFPEGYVQNSEKYTYYFKRKLESDYIYLVFDDWNLAAGTEFFFENSNVAGPVDGGDYRPVVVSDRGHDLRVIFFTGRPSTPSSLMSYIGYKATYQFVNYNKYMQRPITKCGGYFLNSEGGLIKFIPGRINAEHYDCVWVIKTHPSYTKTYLKLISFNVHSAYTNQDDVNYFELRRGLTSEGILLGKVYPASPDRAKLGFTDPVGFYIRLIGKFRPQDSLRLSYASFTEDMSACVGSRTFRCSVDKCISQSLTCDGTNHCGDNSDEIVGCSGSYNDWHKSRQYTITISVIIPMVIAVFLIVILCVLFVLIRRCRRNQLAERCGQDGVPSVSGDVSRRDRRRRRRNGRPRDAPPSYEEVLQNTPVGYLNRNFVWSNPDFPSVLHPPSYEEVIGSPVNQESSEPVNNQLGNASPSSSESGQSEISHHHRNRNSLSSSDSSTTSGRMRPSVHSYSMSYSSDSEIDSPRVNRDIRGEPPLPSLPSTSQLETSNKVIDEDSKCCQVSEHEVVAKTGENKPQYDSVRNSDNETQPNLHIHTQNDVCSENLSNIPKNDEIPGPSNENCRQSASTQTKKKRNGKKKKQGSKRHQNNTGELEINTECSASSDVFTSENTEENQRESDRPRGEDSCQGACQGAIGEDSEQTDAIFSHMDMGTHHHVGHDNLAFCEDENIIRTEERGHNHLCSNSVPKRSLAEVSLAQNQPEIVQSETEKNLTVIPDNGAIDLNGGNNLVKSSSYDAVPGEDNAWLDYSQEQSQGSNISNILTRNVHIDTLPLQSHDGQNGGYFALQREGNEEDIFV